MIRRPAARRWMAWTLAAVLLGVSVVGTAWYFHPWEAFAAPAASAVQPVTAAVEETTLTSQVRLNGQLGYGDTAPLPAAGGTITVLPAAGQVVEPGQRVYEVDGSPVVLFRGSRPFWRDLSVDSEPGEDVRQLKRNLADLGFRSGAADSRFDGKTQQAVRDWQKSLGVPQTGTFSSSSVVVADAPGIRIAQVAARLGESGVSPATYTETTLRATAKLTEAQARTLTPGTPVTVTLPDGGKIDAALSTVDPGGQPIPESDTKTPATATIVFEDQTHVAQAGAVAVRIVIREDAEQSSSLVVPVTALLATSDGGYAVEVWRDEQATRTPVKIGLVADARAQILASGSQIDGATGTVLAPGDLVVLVR